MKVIKFFVFGLFSLIFVSCISQQAAIDIIPTNTSFLLATSTTISFPTSKPEVIATGALMPDGLIMLSPSRYRFLLWPISFSLPDAWDINNKYHFSSTDFGREAYTFYRDDILNTNSNNETSKITVRFATISDGIDIKIYSKETLTNWHGTEMLDIKIFDLKNIGVSLDKSIAYKAYFMFDDVEYTRYIIHAIHQTMGIEIIMDSKTEEFENVASEFLFFLKDLSFE